MLNPNEFTSNASPLAKRFVGALCVAVGIFCSVVFKFDSIAALFFGVPITVTGICLLFDTKRSGSFSPTSLYVTGVFIGVGSIFGALSGEPRMSAGVTFSIACFLLARKRSQKKELW